MSSDSEAEIDLEAETLIFSAPSLKVGGGVHLVDGPTLSNDSEKASLLHSRLCALIILALLVNIFFFLASFTGPAESVVGGFEGYRWFKFVRIVFFSGMLLWLYNRTELNSSKLRLVEIVTMSMVTFFWIYQRFHSVVEVVENQSANMLLGNRYEGMIGLIFIIVTYGMLIPNQWKNTAKAVSTMALAPLAVWVLIKVNRPEIYESIAQLTAKEHTISILMNLFVACVLSTYGAHVLSTMRSKVHEAQKYGQYRLINKLGSGGMGEVHLVEHALLKRPCALKLIDINHTHDQLSLARFEREVQTTASLTHPNTVDIYDYGHTDEGVFYYVMEFLPGLSLGELVKSFGPLPAGRIIHLLRQACQALVEAHEAGLIHRDLKPDNLFVSERGGVCDFVKVLDFGLVKVTNDEEAIQLTADDMVSGTPQYMSPEQTLGETGIDARCDIYALGGICYYMLTGRPPFVGKTVVAVMMAHANTKVIPPSDFSENVPEDLEAIVLRCLAKKPADRYESVSELDKALAECAAASDWNSNSAALWWNEKTVVDEENN